jgi:hypothetical protein
MNFGKVFTTFVIIFPGCNEIILIGGPIKIYWGSVRIMNLNLRWRMKPNTHRLFSGQQGVLQCPPVHSTKQANELPVCQHGVLALHQSPEIITVAGVYRETALSNVPYRVKSDLR